LVVGWWVGELSWCVRGYNFQVGTFFCLGTFDKRGRLSEESTAVARWKLPYCSDQIVVLELIEKSEPEYIEV
jgi:hypothetical protein